MVLGEIFVKHFLANRFYVELVVSVEDEIGQIVQLGNYLVDVLLQVVGGIVVQFVVLGGLGLFNRFLRVNGRLRGSTGRLLTSRGRFAVHLLLRLKRGLGQWRGGLFDKLEYLVVVRGQIDNVLLLVEQLGLAWTHARLATLQEPAYEQLLLVLLGRALDGVLVRILVHSTRQIFDHVLPVGLGRVGQLTTRSRLLALLVAHVHLFVHVVVVLVRIVVVLNVILVRVGEIVVHAAIVVVVLEFNVHGLVVRVVVAIVAIVAATAHLYHTFGFGGGAIFRRRIVARVLDRR